MSICGLKCVHLCSTVCKLCVSVFNCVFFVCICVQLCVMCVYVCPTVSICGLKCVHLCSTVCNFGSAIMWGRIDFGHFPNSRSSHSVNRHRNTALCQIQLKFTFPGRVQEIQIQIQLKTHNSFFTSQAILSYPIGSFESHPSYDIL